MRKIRLTPNLTEELKGIRVSAHTDGYSGQHYSDLFKIGRVVSELEYVRNLNEDCFPDENGNRNRAEYWESYMTETQLKKHKDKKLLITADGRNTNIYAYGFDGYFQCSDDYRFTLFEICDDDYQKVSDAIEEDRLLDSHWACDKSCCMYHYKGIDNHGMPADFSTSLPAPLARIIENEQSLLKIEHAIDEIVRLRYDLKHVECESSQADITCEFRLQQAIVIVKLINQFRKALNYAESNLSLFKDTSSLREEREFINALLGIKN